MKEENKVEEKETNLELIKNAILNGLCEHYYDFEYKHKDNNELCGILAHTPGHYERQKQGEDSEEYWKNILAGAAVYITDTGIQVECFKDYTMLLQFELAASQDWSVGGMGLVVDTAAASIDRFFSFCFGDYEFSFFHGYQSDVLMHDELEDGYKARMRAKAAEEEKELPF